MNKNYLCFIYIFLFVNMAFADLTILHSSKTGKVKPSNIINLEKLQKIANDENIKIKFKPMPWKRALIMVEKGLADGVINASYKVNRAKFGVYPTVNGKLDSSKRLNDGKTYYIYKNRKSTLKWDGKKFINPDGIIGVETNFAVIEDLEKHTNITYETRDQKIAILRDVASKKLSAFAGMSKDYDKLLKEYKSFAKFIVRESIPIRKKDYHLMFSKKKYKHKKIEIEKIWDGLKQFNKNKNAKK